jgi:Transposase DDE domain
MIPIIYQEILSQQLTGAEYLLLQMIVASLQLLKQVKLEVMAESLPLPIQFESRRKKLRRYLGLPIWKVEEIWFRCVLALLKQHPEWVVHDTGYVAIDRTNWGAINLMMVSLIVEHRAIPIYWEFLNKKGSSNLDEQQQVLSKVIQLLAGYKLVVLGDREFCSVKLGKWLGEQNTYFCLRQKKTTKVKQEEDLFEAMKDLGLTAGTKLFLSGVQVGKKKGFGGFNLACKWKKTYRGFKTQEAWFILTNLENLDASILAYQKRFGIEEMFRDFKTGGYSLEGTQMNLTHLSALLIIVAIAYTSAILQGQQIKQAGIQKYVARPENPRKFGRRHSSFYIGQHLHHWLRLDEMLKDIVQELLHFSRHRLADYIRGRRAIALAMNTF